MGKHNVLGETQMMVSELDTLICWARDDGEHEEAIKLLEKGRDYLDHAEEFMAIEAMEEKKR